jgi:hypothetical protein
LIHQIRMLNDTASLDAACRAAAREEGQGSVSYMFN